MKQIACGTLAGLIVVGFVMSTYWLSGSDFVRGPGFAATWMYSWIIGIGVGVGVWATMHEFK